MSTTGTAPVRRDSPIPHKNKEKMSSIFDYVFVAGMGEAKLL